MLSCLHADRPPTAELADRAVADPAFAAKLDAGAELALRWLRKAQELGVARLVHTEGGGIAVEILPPVIH